MTRLFSTEEMRKAAQSLTDGPIVGRKRSEQIKALLRHFHSIGRTLEECGDPLRLDLGTETLKRYARSIPLAFPDYTPMCLREKKPDA